MASVIYNSYKLKLMDNSTKISHATDTLKVALVTSTYTPNIDSHDFFDDITNEVVGTGYTAGGATLASPTATQDSTDDEGVFDAADTTWTTSSLTARAAILYKSTGTASTSPLIAYIDFLSDFTTVGGTLQITWSAEGILNIN
jgi:hypothetical protein